jgi:hypothetical protein
MIFIYTVLLKVSSLIRSHEGPLETHTRSCNEACLIGKHQDRCCLSAMIHDVKLLPCSICAASPAAATISTMSVMG